jgi:hypothetical protein
MTCNKLWYLLCLIDMNYFLLIVTLYRIKNFKGQLTVKLRNSSAPICLDNKIRKNNRTKNPYCNTWVFLVASSLLCDSILVEIKCINVCCNTTVFSNCWRKLLHVSALICRFHIVYI